MNKNIINVLPTHVANQIAAGEVVQRPSSVVKELLENSIDSSASEIKLLIKSSGKTLIQVIDNGTGMNPSDSKLCFKRHSTSKINVAEDLYSLKTKGFRGEALASIAAISHVELRTKIENEAIGTLIKINGGVLEKDEKINTATGTFIAVKNLFYNTPARRNFLKSDSVELRHIINEFQRIALIHPEVNFTFHHNKNNLFDLRSETFKQRIVHIFGNKMNEKLVPIDENTELLKISGFVLKPQFARKSRGEQFFFVNKRFIKSHYLNHAIVTAFEGLMVEKKYPGYFLVLDVNPNSIDVNIHPTKTEIKFSDDSTIYALIRAAVKHSLGQFNITPMLDFDRNPSFDTPYKQFKKSINYPKVEINSSFNPFLPEPGSIKKKLKEIDPNFIGFESKSNSDSDSSFENNFEKDIIQSSIFETDISISSANTFQLKNKYIVSTTKSGLVIINQNLAHQRILYERYLRLMTNNSTESQKLIFPINLNYSTKNILVIKKLKSQLSQAGFNISKLKKNTLTLNSIPSLIKESEVNDIFDQIISDVENEIPGFNFSQIDLLAKSMSKSLAIKNGKELKTKEQEFILNSLFACIDPNISPSNKKTFIMLKFNDIDSKFN
mgnify:CR=1 FL=1